MESVSVAELVEQLELHVANGVEYTDRLIYSSEVSRPGLVLTGYKDYFPHERVQLIGRTEIDII